MEIAGNFIIGAPALEDKLRGYKSRIAKSGSVRREVGYTASVLGQQLVAADPVSRASQSCC
jgi:hypothetical protein